MRALTVLGVQAKFIEEITSIMQADRLTQNYKLYKLLFILCLGQREQKPFPVQQHIPVFVIYMLRECLPPSLPPGL